MNNVFKLIITMTFYTTHYKIQPIRIPWGEPLTVLRQTFSSYAALIVLAGQCFFFLQVRGYTEENESWNIPWNTTKEGCIASIHFFTWLLSPGIFLFSDSLSLSLVDIFEGLFG